MSGAWTNDLTTSLTLPTGAVNPDQRIVLDGSTDTILVYDVSGALIASVAATGGTDGFGNTYPAGISAASGVISQSIFLLYNGTPALGNLVMSLTSDPGSDSFGNNYQAGFTVYDTATGNPVRNIDISGIDSIGETGSAQFIINPTTGQIQFISSAGLVTGEIDSNTGAILFYTSTTTVTDITASGSFVVPANVTSLKVECWGAGGGGRSGTTSGASGGGGGEYAQEPSIMVTPGETLTCTVGTGGTAGVGANGGAGGNTIFLRSATALVTAHGGPGGVSGAAVAGGTGSTNTIHHNGGGSPRSTAAASQGGSGGGESGAPTVAGAAGLVNSGTTGGAGGSGTAGFNGGSGGAGTGTAGTAGANGTAGGGGGGAGGRGSSSGSNGGAGGRGLIRITYTNTATLQVSVAAVAGTDQFGNSYPQGIQVGNNVTSNLKLLPATPSTILQSSDANGDLALNLDATNGTLTILDNVNLGSVDLNPHITTDLTTGGTAYTAISSAGTLPTSTQISNAGRIGLNGAGIAINMLSPAPTLAGRRSIVRASPINGTSNNPLVEILSSTGNNACDLQVYGTLFAANIMTAVVSITPVANTPTMVTLNYGTTLQGSSFMCQTTPNTSVPGSSVVETSYNSLTSTSVNVWIYRTNTTTTSVSVLVIGF